MGKGAWIGAILVMGLCFWGMSYVLTPDNGDVEFQKMLDATKQIKSFRGTFVGITPSTQHSERLWEVDCNQTMVHKQSQDLSTGAIPVETKEDQLFVGSDQKYTRNADGSWDKTKYTFAMYSASWYCDRLAEGTVRDLLPDIRAMLRNATFGKGDKKTVNGVRCQDWKFSMHSANSGVRGTVCIGLEDHLPYEMTTDNGGRYSYTDYNRSVQFDVPDGLQPVSSSQGSN